MLTQRRAHPTVVNSTPAGERQRPRVRRCHEEKTRAGLRTSPTSCLRCRYCVSQFGRTAHAGLFELDLSSIRYRNLDAVSRADTGCDPFVSTPAGGRLSL